MNPDMKIPYYSVENLKSSSDSLDQSNQARSGPTFRKILVKFGRFEPKSSFYNL